MVILGNFETMKLKFMSSYNSETFKLYQFPTPFHNTMSGSITDQTVSESIKDQSDKMAHDFEQFANDIFNEFKKRLSKSGNTWEIDPIIRHLLLPAFLQARSLNAQEKYHGWGG